MANVGVTYVNDIRRLCDQWCGVIERMYEREIAENSSRRYTAVFHTQRDRAVYEQAKNLVLLTAPQPPQGKDLEVRSTDFTITFVVYTGSGNNAAPATEQAEVYRREQNRILTSPRPRAALDDVSKKMGAAVRLFLRRHKQARTRDCAVSVRVKSGERDLFRRAAETAKQLIATPDTPACLLEAGPRIYLITCENRPLRKRAFDQKAHAAFEHLSQNAKRRKTCA